MLDFIKIIASKLPKRFQQKLKKLYYAKQIRAGKFSADEEEYFLLDSFISCGDWVIDIGANIGHYTAKFSQLVGEEGRVIALEPVNATFELLVSNYQYFKHQNVTLLNLGASDESGVISMEIPIFKTGLKNYFEAKITDKETEIKAFVIPIDNLSFPQKIKLIKIDTEGHELHVLKGMNKLIKRDYPILIVEASSSNFIDYLIKIGYTPEKINGSPNFIFKKICI